MQVQDQSVSRGGGRTYWLLMVGLSIPSVAEAVPCGNWSPVLLVGNAPVKQSSSLEVRWTASGPTSCTNTIGDSWGGTDHLELHRKSGLTPPGAPQTNTLVANFTSSSPFVDFMYRADKSFTYTLFACQNSSCTSWYGDGSGNNESKSNTSNDGQTQVEKWILRGVTGEADVTSAVVQDPEANAPHAFFYPSDWLTDYSDELALYYFKKPGGSPSAIYYVAHDSVGVPMVRFNDSTNWGSPVLVAQGSTDTDDDDYNADHPWAMLTEDDSDKRIQLFVQSQHPTGNKYVIQIESTDEIGNDFDRDCGSPPCSETFLSDSRGYVAVDADGSSDTNYVDKAMHGRVVWDYITDSAIVAGTDEPSMMLQIQRPYTGDICVSDGDPPPDLTPDDGIGKATASWNGTQWEWSVATVPEVWDGGTHDCPEELIPAAHDNGSVSIDGGHVIKMYYKKYSDGMWYVAYWDGVEWGDEVAVQFRWDGSVDGPSHACVENVVTVPYGTGALRLETMFFKLLDSDSTSCSPGVGFDSGAGDQSAIVSAELAN